MAIGLLVFLGFALLVFVAVRRAYRRMVERQRLVQMHPDEPWLWRQDWADRAVQSTDSVKAGFLWFFAILWNLISLPLLFAFKAQENQLAFWFAALFPLVGVFVFIAAIYLTLRRRKYGVSVCHLQQLPVPIGGMFRGEVEARVRQMPESGFQVHLTNLQRIVRGSGKNRSVREVVLWDDEKVVGSGAAMPSPNGMRIPVQFAIPATADPTDDSNSRDSILWRLEVTADVPGIDYRGVFEIPVFRTGEVSDERFAASPSPWTPPAYIVMDGDEITIRARRPIGDWIGYLGFIALWFGALEFARRFGAPLWIVLIFAAFGTVVLLAAADLLLRRTKISVTREGLISRASWLGLGGSRTIAAHDVEDVVARTGRTQGTQALYDVQAQLRSGATVFIAKHLNHRRDAEALAARITNAIGRSKKF